MSPTARTGTAAEAVCADGWGCCAPSVAAPMTSIAATRKGVFIYGVLTGLPRRYGVLTGLPRRYTAGIKRGQVLSRTAENRKLRRDHGVPYPRAAAWQRR